jgi:putative ATP-dependent endonuclease of the OLD family
MGIEEPELYQPPPQARYLSEVLQGLSTSNSQIVVCTHSPLFIPGDDFESVRVVRDKGTPSASHVAEVTYNALAKKLKDCGQELLKHCGMLAKLASTLTPSLSEMFFCRVLILVEGMEDVAHISTYLELEKEIDSFRRYGCHIVPAGKKSEFARPLAVAKALGIPVYAVFDADTNTDPARTDWINMHKAENKVLLALANHSSESEWPTADIWHSDLTVWSANIGTVVQSEIGAVWSGHFNEAKKYFGNAAKLEKNPLAVAKTLELAWNAGHKSASLSKLVKNVTAFAKSSV